MKISIDPRLPVFGGIDYAKSLYARLYALFREIAQAINGNADDITGRVAILDAAWLGKAVGEVFALRDDLSGVSPPPTDSDSYRFIRLTAADSYNDGVLTDEAVSGSAPLVVATAQISLEGSPINGLTVNLWNTERRSPRAGSAGVLQDDATGPHKHYLRRDGADFANYADTASLNGYTMKAGANNSGSARLSADEIHDGRTDTETRIRNQGVTYYMRVL